ncbi:cupin domain-containing protein [Xanthobacter aminoxidans]|uniref:cupin domain-containing protein n=1 Tax=Xanthobacter aminoxidans TaxID=186280 RepID=UPI0037293169
MLARRRFISCAICSLAGFAATQVGGSQAMAQGQASPAAAPAAAPAGISRKVLGRTDVPGDKYVAILMEAEFDGGIKVARHTHPGIESIYLISGGGVLSVKGQPDRTLAAGDGVQIPPEVPHAFQVGADKTKAAITYIVEKDKPLATPAPE